MADSTCAVNWFPGDTNKLHVSFLRPCRWICMPFLLQMVLPVGFERDNNKVFEEVHIPAASSAPAEVGQKLIPISQLDEVNTTYSPVEPRFSLTCISHSQWCHG